MDHSWALLVVGGALTLAGSVSTSLLQGWMQRRGVREDRVWGRRAELYVDLLDAAESNLSEGRTRAFASTRVRDLCEELLAAQEVFITHVNRGHDGGSLDEWEVELQKLIRKVTTTQSRLEEKIRSELRIKEPSSWRSKP